MCTEIIALFKQPAPPISSMIFLDQQYDFPLRIEIPDPDMIDREGVLAQIQAN